ncbi:MAG TPA: DUF423 domain-containing protein [Chitinophagaceae bacterium]|nr:DUF423 domain-containing protein [Chitinophagaceae bacterium]
MHKNYLGIAALLGAVTVAIGAFGAHGLQRITSDPVILHSYQTAVQYQMVHVLALLAVGILFERFSAKWLSWAANFFLAGIFFFSGSIYVITYLKIKGMSTGWIGPVTPVGGLLFIAGWLFLLIAVQRKKA